MKIRLKHPPEGLNVSRGNFWISHEAADIMNRLNFKDSVKWFYVVLCKISDKKASREWWFKTNNAELKVIANMSRGTVYLARRALVLAGLIEEG